MKFKVLALVAMMFAAPVFAADYVVDLTQGTGISAASIDVAADASTALTTGYAPALALPYSTNVALIQQDAAVINDVAVIDQSAATSAGNYAAISQLTANASVAYIFQSAATSFAFIKQ
jgi:hypothetical protein